MTRINAEMIDGLETLNTTVKALAGAALLATLPLAGSNLAAKGDGVKLSDLAISLSTPSTVTSATAIWTTADVGKIISVRGAGTAAGGVTNGQSFGPSIAPLFATIVSINNTHSVQISVPASQAVTSATGAYGTDDTTAIRALHLVSSLNGRAIIYPAGVYCVARPIDNLANTTVQSYGRHIIFSDPTNAGGMIILKAGDDNYIWNGGIIDGGDLTNMNGVAAAYDPVGAIFSQNIVFNPTLITGCRMNLAMHAASSFSGGGKAYTCQFHLNGMLANTTISDCDIGISIEGAQTNNQLTSNVGGKLIIKNCPYAAGFFGGSVPAGDGSTTIAGADSTRYGQARLVLEVDNCGTLPAIGAICSPFWGNWPSFLNLDAFVRSSVAANFTPWKGNVGHGCKLKIHCVSDTMADGIDLSAFTGASLSAFSTYGPDIDLTLECKTTLTGGLFRGAGLEGRATLKADYLFPSSPGTLFAGISNSATVTYELYNRLLGKTRMGSTAGSLSNLNGDPYRLDFEYVAIGKILAFQPATTVPPLIPSGTQVALAEGMLAVSDGTPQSGGFGSAGPGVYVSHILSIAGSGSSAVATVSWSRLRLDGPPLDFTSAQALNPAQSGVILTNNGATSRVDLTLPVPGVNNRGGLVFPFCVISANGIRVNASAGGTITIPGVGTSSVGGYMQSTTVGANLRVRAMSTALYIAEGNPAGWTVA